MALNDNCEECPLVDKLDVLVDQDCPMDFRQVSGFAIGVRGTPFTDDTVPGTDIQALAAWTTRIAAADDTQIVVVQKVSSFLIPSTEKISEAPDTNDTPDGIELILDETTAIATFTLKDLTSTVWESLRKLYCETKGYELGIMPFNHSQVGDQELDFIPITSFFVPTPGMGGKTASNNTPCTFNMSANWFKNFTQRNVDFDPLTLKNA